MAEQPSLNREFSRQFKSFVNKLKGQQSVTIQATRVAQEGNSAFRNLFRAVNGQTDSVKENTRELKSFVKKFDIKFETKKTPVESRTGPTNLTGPKVPGTKEEHPYVNRDFSREFKNFTEKIKAQQSITMQTTLAAENEIRASGNLLRAFDSQTDALKGNAIELRLLDKELHNVKSEIYNGKLEQEKIIKDPTRSLEEKTGANQLIHHYESKLKDLEILEKSLNENRQDLRSTIGESATYDKHREMASKAVEDVNQIFGIKLEDTLEKVDVFKKSMGSTRGIIVQVAAALAALGAVAIHTFNEWYDEVGNVGQALTQTGKSFGASWDAITHGVHVSIGTSAAVARELSEHLGTLKVPNDVISDAGMLSSLFKISASEAAEIVGHLRLLYGGNMDNVRAVEKYVKALALSNNVAPRAVLKDMADNMELLARYGRENVKNFVDATVEAKKLGTSIGHIDSMMDGMLDFENSLGAEMQASALIGKRLDFSKARQASLHNDAKGAMDAVKEQLGGIDVGHLNRIQQDALKRSVPGLDLDEIVKMGEFQRMGEGSLNEADMSKGETSLVDKMGTYTDAIGSFTKILGALIVANGIGTLIRGLGRGVSGGILSKIGVGAATGVAAGELTGTDSKQSGLASAGLTAASLFAPSLWRKFRGGKNPIASIVETPVASFGATAKGGKTAYEIGYERTFGPKGLAGVNQGVAGVSSTRASAVGLSSTGLSTGLKAGAVGGISLAGGALGYGASKAMGGGDIQNKGAGIGGVAGGAIGGIVGSFVPVIGTIVGSMVGSAVGSLAGGLIGNAMEDKPTTNSSTVPSVATTSEVPQVAEMDTTRIVMKLDEVIHAVRTSMNVRIGGKDLHSELAATVPRGQFRG